MTKQQILVKIRRQVEEAWLALARDAYLRCPRISVGAMFDFQHTDVEQARLRQVWHSLQTLADSIGDVAYDAMADDMCYKASDLNSALYRECRAAEERQ